MSKFSQFFRAHRDKIILIFSIVLSVGMLASLHGLLPGMIRSESGALAARYTTYGAIECAAESFEDLIKLKCSSLGGDVPFRSPTNSPFIFLAGGLKMITGISVEYVYSVVALMILTLALVGGYLLNRTVGMRRLVALPLAGLFLVTPILLSLQSFGGTYWGLMLLPFTIYFTWRSWTRLDTGMTKSKYALLSLAWVVISVGMLFLDGYAFFMNATVAAILWLTWSWRRWNTTKVWIGLAMFVAASAIAYAAYIRIFSDAGDGSDIGLFRAMGLDLITLFIPSAGLWWSELFSGGHEALGNLWGDGSNSVNNFLGFITFGVAITSCIYLVRNKKITRLIAGLCIAGAVAFVLSLGPSLKINSERGPLPEPITYQSYLMPAESAVVGLPTEILYENVPGLSSMRATYRWHVITVLTIIILAGVGLSRLTRRRAPLGFIILTLLIIELLPNPISTISNNRAMYDQLNLFNEEVVEPLRSKLKLSEQIVYYPSAGNDYLASYLTPTLDIQSYNTGNDKVLARASVAWPSDVRELLQSDPAELTYRQQGELVKKVLMNESASAVIVPYFNLRWSAYAWPPDMTGFEKAQAVTQYAKEDEELVIYEDTFFSVIRLRAE